MNTWTLQMGHPVIKIERVTANTIKITQKQFLYDPNSPPNIVSPYKFDAFI